jgi:mannose-6-phosphate isomerase
MLPPLTFDPLFQERVWGGQSLARLYGKALPSGVPVGESWELSDRPGAESVVRFGPWAGRSLHWLMEHHAEELLGGIATTGGRFPWLVKLLDARETLSIQVHPPSAMARRLGGQPKTEMWYVAEARPGAMLYAGVAEGVTRADLERAIQRGSVAECVRSLPVVAGDVLFLPSGRLHALGSGLVIFEIQENSDTTYRVFDWNRTGLDGRPRTLHIQESLDCIDFNDHQPVLIRTGAAASPGFLRWPLVRDPLFHIDLLDVPAGPWAGLAPGTLTLLGVVSGQLTLRHPILDVHLRPGEFALVPASAGRVVGEVNEPARCLVVRPGGTAD